MIFQDLTHSVLQRNRLWSEAIAIGNNDFLENIHSQLKEKNNTVGKKVTCGNMTVLKEPHSAYNALFDAKKGPVSPENTYCIDVTGGNKG